MVKKPQYHCIGHCCHDQKDDAYTLGGTAAFAALVAHQLGWEPVIQTSVGDDFRFLSVFEDRRIEFHSAPSDHTTVFENIEETGHRTQYLRAHATDIDVKLAVETAEHSPIVHLCPVANEVPISRAGASNDCLVGATMQGWLRTWDAKGLIRPKAMAWQRLSHIDIAILSDEDIRGYPAFLQQITRHCDHVICTHGGRGATVYRTGVASFFPAYATHQSIDTTGAGDAFAAAYFIGFRQSRSVRSACVFAQVVASMWIEQRGWHRHLPDGEIKARWQRYVDRFDMRDVTSPMLM